MENLHPEHLGIFCRRRSGDPAKYMKSTRLTIPKTAFLSKRKAARPAGGADRILILRPVYFTMAAT
jgi:hypothetical protein